MATFFEEDETPHDVNELIYAEDLEHVPVEMQEELNTKILEQTYLFALNHGLYRKENGRIYGTKADIEKIDLLIQKSNQEQRVLHKKYANN